MHALAKYIMRGPVQALLVTATLALVSLIPVLGMVSVLSGAAVALVTLRHGAKQGLMVLLGASLVTSIFMYFVFGTMVLGLMFALLLWLPLLGLALVLRSSRSWSMVLDAAAAIGITGIALFYLFVGDPLKFWLMTLGKVLEFLSAQGGMTEMDKIAPQIPIMAEWITGMLAAALVMGLVLSMMLARWWQSLLFNSWGFQQEFYGLRQSKMAAFTVLLILTFSLFDLGVLSNFAGDIMITVVVVYSIVGLALIHALVARSGKHSAWLVGIYVLMFIMLPHMLMALASIGFADSWLDFRSRLSGSKP